MLVEVIVVTVVVATIMTSLYVLFNRVYNTYDKKNQYTDVDTIYALKMIEDYLVDNFKLNELINNTSTYSEIVCGDAETYCNSVFKEYNINKMYIVKKTGLTQLKDNVSNETFKEYIEYLINAVDTDKYSELLIVETYTIKEEDKKNILNKYAYLPTRTIKK